MSEGLSKERLLEIIRDPRSQKIMAYSMFFGLGFLVGILFSLSVGVIEYQSVPTSGPIPENVWEDYMENAAENVIEEVS